MEYIDKRPGATTRRRFPTRVAGRWIVAWAASIALFVALRTAGHGPFVAVLGWAVARAVALPAHPTLAQTLDALPLTLALPLLFLAVIVALTGPLLLPVIAALHVAVAWVRGGAR